MLHCNATGADLLLLLARAVYGAAMPGTYAIIVAAMSFVVGLIFVPETKDRDIRREIVDERKATT